MSRRLYRSRSNSMIAGVCGGLGSYLGVDPTIVRLIFTLLAFTGMGLLLYPALWLIVPKEGQDEINRVGAQQIDAGDAVIQDGDADHSRLEKPLGISSGGGLFAGVALMLFGLVLLVQNLHIYWLRWITVDLIWPLLLILGGILIVRWRAEAE